MATAAKQWKQSAFQVLTLPSGNVAACKRSGVETFIKSGRVPNALMPMLKEAMAGKRPEEPASAIITDENMLRDMFEMFDVVTIASFVDPKVHEIPAEGVERNDELLYVDEIDMTDKQFIFQWAVGGTADLEKFRKGLAEHVGALQQGQAVLDTSVDAAIHTE